MTSGVLRSINTAIWDDPYVRDLSIKQKLIWMYLLSNRLTTMAGIYEITIDKIVFDLKITIDIVTSTFIKFEKDDKIYYYENYLIMRNHLKNHHMNTNMQKGAMKIIDTLPEDVTIFLFKDIRKVPKTFDKLKRFMLNMSMKIDHKLETPPEKKPESKTEYIKFDFTNVDDKPIKFVKLPIEDWERLVNRTSTKFAIKMVCRLDIWYRKKNKRVHKDDYLTICQWIAKDQKENKKGQL